MEQQPLTALVFFSFPLRASTLGQPNLFTSTTLGLLLLRMRAQDCFMPSRVVPGTDDKPRENGHSGCPIYGLAYKAIHSHCPGVHVFSTVNKFVLHHGVICSMSLLP